MCSNIYFIFLLCTERLCQSWPSCALIVLQQLQTENGEISNDSAEKANLLNNYFANVFQVEGNKPIPEFPDRPFLEPILTITIDQAVILRAIDKIKSSKISGP